MKQIDLDDEVYGYIKKKSIWEDKNPNDTLRRLFGFRKKPEIKRSSKKITKTYHRKKPKADLRKLVQSGMLQDGQKLVFHYQEKLSNEYEAKIMSGDLLWNSELYSMSKLVAVILKDEGYDIPSEAYRGPAYWYNDKGKSIKDLWEQYLLEYY